MISQGWVRRFAAVEQMTDFSAPVARRRHVDAGLDHVNRFGHEVRGPTPTVYPTLSRISWFDSAHRERANASCQTIDWLWPVSSSVVMNMVPP